MSRHTYTAYVRGIRMQHTYTSHLYRAGTHDTYMGVRFRRKPRCAKGSVSGIAYHRKRKGLNQTQLAALIGTRQCAICLYESGKRTPSLQVLRRLSAVLDVAIDDLVQTYEVAEDE